jgi:HSP20 family protein
MFVTLATRLGFGEMGRLRSAIDRFLGEPLLRPSFLRGFLGGGQLPALDVKLTDDALIVKAALPGVEPDKVETTIAGDRLVVSGTYAEEHEAEEEGYLRRELSRGEFSRSITLPHGLRTTDAEATFDNGLLTLRIPRTAEEKPQPIKITAKTGRPRPPKAEPTP